MKLLSLALFLAVLAPPQDPTFTLVWKPKAEDRLDYRMTMELEIEGQRMEYGADILMKVVKVAENGDYEVETRTKSATIKVGGEETELDDEDEPTLDKYNAKGEKIEDKSKSDEEEEDQDPLTLNILDPITDFNTPEGPLKKGQKWSHEVKADEKKGVFASKVEYEVMGAEKRDEWETVRVSVKLTQTEGSTPAKAEGHFLISTKDGSLVDFVVKVEDFKPGPDEPKGNASIKMIRK